MGIKSGGDGVICPLVARKLAFEQLVADAVHVRSAWTHAYNSSNRSHRRYDGARSSINRSNDIESNTLFMNSLSSKSWLLKKLALSKQMTGRGFMRTTNKQ
ncbi:hypothetical protein BpHYR1_044449 [Brachionus plicatilis]|uniref:Uncharacterized protein n=1 Tax=Brachionus plicatilis TaxID=10195 RepID=A0A3M7QSH4_BRAPC|nr:hypothetical protein BpHYR1_044449 [Brachionus plicatilis]